MQIVTRDKEMEMLPEKQAKMMKKKKDTKCLLKMMLIFFKNAFIKSTNGKF